MAFGHLFSELGPSTPRPNPGICVFMKVCIVGGSGLVGSHLLEILAQNPAIESVTALTRSPLKQKAPKTKELLIDFDHMEKSAPSIEADVYVSCLGTTIKTAGSKAAFKKVDHDYVLAFGKMAEKAGARKFYVVSAMGADPKSAIFYNRTKGEMETDIAQLKIGEIGALRPSLLLGHRQESRPLEVVAQKAFPILNGLLQGPFKKYRAIHAKDVARAICRLILSNSPGFSTYESDQIESLK